MFIHHFDGKGNFVRKPGGGLKITIVKPGNPQDP